MHGHARRAQTTEARHVSGTTVGTEGIKHKTLSAYYPFIRPLRDHLAAACNGGGSSSGLERDADPEEYTQLLRGCLVASAAPVSASRPPPVGQAATQGSQQDAIDRILVDITRGDTSGRNVLLFGLKASFAVGELPINTNRPAFENRHANSPSAVLRSLAWRILRARVGDTVFRDLLVRYSLFVSVGNNCYIQLSGAPLFDLYDHDKQARAVPAAASTSAILGQATKRCGDGEIINRRHRKRQRQPEKRADELGQHGQEVQRVHTLHKGAADRLILRGRMFYGRPKKDKSGRLHLGVPAHHPLNKHQPRSGSVVSDATCLTMMQAIFPSMFARPMDSGAAQSVGLVAGLHVRGNLYRLGSMTGMIRELLARHAEIDYAALLRRCRDRKAGRVDGLEPVTQRSVYRFVSQIVKQLLPVSIIGSEHNLGVLLGHIRHFIEMRQHEVISLHTLMLDFKVLDFAWSHGSTGQRTNASESLKMRRLAEDLVFWIFNDLLIPLLRNTFYITETAASRYETVYFLHQDWDAATQLHLRQLEVDLLEELQPDQAYFARQGPLGVSAVRLVPKPNGFRPIVNLGKRLSAKNTAGVPIYGSNKTLSANQVLRGVHQVLTYEKDRHKHEMGCTLFGTNEVFAPLQQLKQELTQRHRSLPRLYFVKMDIKSAFDTIKQDKMLEIVEDLLDKNHDYCLVLYSLLLPPASEASQGSARRLFKTKAIVNDGQSAAFGHHAKIIAQPLRNAVIVDMMRRRHVTKDDCLALLRTHIQHNVWEVDGKCFRQKVGIPQGSKISSLLCSFFYAVLEREHLSFVNAGGSRLLRYIDDFLFISDDLALARRFAQRMQDGFPEFGAFVAQGKTLLSFEFATGSQVAPVCLGVDGKEYFPFCGFLIDTSTLDLSMDYARALSTHIKQSFALRSHRHRAGFVGWFSRQLENRNHVAYLDTEHNDARTVRLNIFLNFALTTMKVPHYFALGPEESLSRSRADKIAESLCQAVEYTYVAGRARVKHASRNEESRGDHYAVKKRDFTRIALSAVVKVLSSKAAQWSKVVDALKSQLDQTQRAAMLQNPLDLEAILQEGWAAVKDARY